MGPKLKDPCQTTRVTRNASSSSPNRRQSVCAWARANDKWVEEEERVIQGLRATRNCGIWYQNSPSSMEGAELRYASVTVENIATGVKATATTDQSGGYRVSNLLPGTYNLNVTAKGFTAASVKNLNVDMNRAVTANVTLQVGSTTETVEVNAAAVQIDTTTAQVQNTFETKTVADLPTASIGLGVLNLSLLSSGVSSIGAVGAGTGP